MENPTISEPFKGALPLLRKFREHPFWCEKRSFSRAEAWIDLLFKARYSSEITKILDRGEVIEIGYAQILTSKLTLARDWQRSPTWIRALIDYLVKNNSIKIIEMNNRRTIIEIVKLGEIKEQLQKSSQQNIRQSKDQKSNKNTYKNTDNNQNKNINYCKADIKNDQSCNKNISSIREILKKYQISSGMNISTPYQAEALHYANKLKINLDDSFVKKYKLDSRWISLFKQANFNTILKSKLATTYSKVADYTNFLNLKSHEKILYFFKCFSND